MSIVSFLAVLTTASASSAFTVPDAVPAPSLPWWRVALLVALFVGLLAVWFRVNKGRMNLRGMLQPGPQEVFVRERRWVDSRTSVSLVEVGGERFLLAQSHGAVAWQPLPPAKTPSSHV